MTCRLLASAAALALLCACGTDMPSWTAPRLVSAWESCDYHSATLDASFDRVDNISSCGFVLNDGGDSQTVELPAGDGHLQYVWTGLKPDTEYSWSVRWSNGLDEEVSASRTFCTEKAPYDPVLWHFLLENYDADGDGLLSSSETDNVTETVISDLPLESLSGLELLGNLENLAMGGNGLTSIDMSPFPNLLGLSAGRERYLREIHFDNPRLYVLYIIACPNLSSFDISSCGELWSLSCWDVALESLDVSRNLLLETVQLSGTKLRELDLSANRRIRVVDVAQNSLLETVWLREGTELESCKIGEHTLVCYK